MSGEGILTEIEQQAHLKEVQQAQKIYQNATKGLDNKIKTLQQVLV